MRRFHVIEEVVMPILAVLPMVGILTYIWLLLTRVYAEIPDPVHSLFGALVVLSKDTYGYYFGSSKNGYHPSPTEMGVSDKKESE